MLDGIQQAFRETLSAITANRDREIGIFIVPLIAVIFLTAAQYTIILNQSKPAIFNALNSSGVCNTYQPYLITSVMGSFQGDPLAHVGMCQALSFNVFVFMAWFLESLAIVLVTIFIFEAIFHLG